MAATVIINEWNGVGAKTDKTSGTVRFKNADNATVDLNDPLTVPTANTEYSYEKWLRVEVTGGTYSRLSTLRAYSDGASGWQAGVKMWYWTRSEFSNPAIPVETNDPPQSAGSPADSGANFFSATSGSPIVLDALNPGPASGGWEGGSPGGEGDIGDFLVMVMEVEIGSTQGLQSAESLTISWSEI